ncbi:MAG TPA: TetR/AcrR family transcriptional regulator [Candidatus Egerieimonas intestinavium]|uniref:TetR/AcrR family transcriptional regulator n=1 Tax=Candidatus Egerieimonas intestinavium TaxID=2840777 RepID=A0A9D1EJQ7_9FIRM|nr:TetR/AcrR family transcriptional regulator [Candidatus Egerieimonas intestinavium]
METKRKSQANLLARECIVKALLQLAQTKPLSSITISELTERAGVSRMTFYRNYRSKEDVFSSYLREILEDYHETDLELDMPEPYYGRRRMINCFRHGYRYRDFFDGLIQCGFGNIFLKYLTAYVISKWTREDSTTKDRYKLAAFSGQLYNLYIYWSENHYRESPQELADIVGEIYGSLP